MTSPELSQHARVLLNWLKEQGRTDFQKADICTHRDCLALMEAYKGLLGGIDSTSLLVLCNAMQILIKEKLLRVYTLAGYEHVRVN